MAVVIGAAEGQRCQSGWEGRRKGEGGVDEKTKTSQGELKRGRRRERRRRTRRGRRRGEKEEEEEQEKVEE